MRNNKKNIYFQLIFWFVKIVHLYSAGPESKIELSYVSAVCVYGGRRGRGLEVLKWFVRGGQNFFYLLCVYICVCVGGGGQVQYLSFREKKITDPPPINK